MTEGHLWLKETLNVTVHYGWQIDPFGHSSLTPTMFAQMGFKAMIGNRINDQIKNNFKSSQELDFVWEGSGTLRNDSQLLVHLLYDHYGYPEIYPTLLKRRDWELKFDRVSKKFFNLFKNVRDYYRTDVIMIPLGDDFTYTEQDEFDINDDLLKTMRSKMAEHNIRDIRYATLTEFFDMMIPKLQSTSIPIYKQDFFPYVTNGVEPWSGFYSSHSLFKKQVRDASTTIRTADMFYGLAMSKAKSFNDSHLPELSSFYKGMKTARRNIAITQHHDSVTGTARSYVMNDYMQKLDESLTNSIDTLVNSLEYIININGSGDSGDSPLVFHKIVDLDELTNRPLSLVFANSLGSRQTTHYSIRVSLSSAKKLSYLHILDSRGKTINYQTVPVTLSSQCPRAKQSETEYIIFLIIDIPPVGFETYYLTLTDQSSGQLHASKITTYESSSSFAQSSTQLANKFMTVHFKRTGFIRSVIKSINSTTIDIKVDESGDLVEQLVLYFHGEHDKCDPKSIIMHRVYKNPDLADTKPLLSEETVEVGYSVVGDPNRETVFNYETNIQSKNLFYTDNGVETRKRDGSDRTQSIAYHYYPALNFVNIKDDQYQFTVFTERSQGVASPKPGGLEVMIHRNLQQDDEKGLTVPNRDGARVDGHHMVTSHTETLLNFMSKPSTLPAHDAIRGIEVKGELVVPLLTGLPEYTTHSTMLLDRRPPHPTIVGISPLEIKSYRLSLSRNQTNDLGLNKWWEETSEEKKLQLKALLDNGQFEFVGGGWVQNDEAVSNFNDVLDQMTEGHLWLKDNLNQTVDYAWQIDPFGHSSLTPTMFAQFGFKGMIANRIDTNVKNELKSKQQLDFIWEGSATLGDKSRMYVHMLYDHYGYPDIYPVHLTTADWTDNKYKVSVGKKFFELFQQVQHYYKTDVIMIPLGDDFAYDYEGDFEINDGLVDYLKSHASEYNIKDVRYATLSEFFDLLVPKLQENHTVPLFKKDFFPYITNSDEPWTGFYSSHSLFKKQVRDASSSIRTADAFYALAMAKGKAINDKSLPLMSSLYQGMEAARRNLGIMQHHDSVTGTARSYVMNDYMNMLDVSFANSMGTLANSLEYIINISGQGDSSSLEFHKIIDLDKLLIDETMSLVFANSLGSNYNSHYSIRVTVQSAATLNNLVIKNSQRSQVQFQSVPIHQYKTKKSGAYLFIPQYKMDYLTGPRTTYFMIKGALVEQLVLYFHSGANDCDPKSIIMHRVYKNPDTNATPLTSEETVELGYSIVGDPNRETVFNFDTNIKSNHTFYTDNGLETRLRQGATTSPSISYHYYPTLNFVNIKDDQYQFTVFTERSQGVGMPRDGGLEVMIHRNLLQDDWKGLTAPNRHSARVDGRLFLGFNKIEVFEKTQNQYSIHLANRP
eukprot:gene15071-17840_t